MGETGAEFWRAFNECRKRDRAEKLPAKLEEARLLIESTKDILHWTVHNEYHLSTRINGHRLDFWPTRGKFRYKRRTHNGGITGFVRRQIERSKK